MTRRAWIPIIAVVAAAIITGTIGIVAIATDDHEPTPAVQARGQAPNAQQDGSGRMRPWNEGGQHDMDRSFRDGDGRGWLSSDGSRDGAWQPLFGLPWLAGGLLIGLGVTLLVWRPWGRPSPTLAGPAVAGPGTQTGATGVTAAPAEATAAQGADVSEAATTELPSSAAAQSDTEPEAGATEPAVTPEPATADSAAEPDAEPPASQA